MSADPPSRRLRRRWLVAGVGFCVVALALVYQAPSRARVELRYLGHPVAVPREVVLAESLWAHRCIPFWSCNWSLFAGFSKRIETRTKSVVATPHGVTVETNDARTFSLGRYRVESSQLIWNTSGASEEKIGSGDYTPRRREDADGRLRADYHILDVTSVLDSFRVPLLPPPGGEITIDFDPIVYTVFEDLPYRERWNTGDTRCSPAVPWTEVDSSVPRAFRYHTTVLPKPQAGQPLPLAASSTTVFLIDGVNMADLVERPSPENWKRLQERAIHPPEVQVEHDSNARRITVRMTAMPKGEVVLVAGTPSADGRYFGLDCLRFKLKRPTDREAP